MFGLRMVSVKKVKNRSEASGPSAVMTAGSATVTDAELGDGWHRRRVGFFGLGL